MQYPSCENPSIHDETLNAQEETKQRIMEIAEELEYEVRVQKKRKKKLKIGVFCSYSPKEELEDPYYLCIRLAIEKKFYFTETTPICRNMKKVTLEKVLHVLKTGENEVFVDDKLREESKKPLERMLELAK